MKNILFIALTLISISFVSCKKCRKEDPRAKVVNNGTQGVSVQIQTTGGNTVNINNVLPGTSSEWNSFASGTVLFNVGIGQGNQAVVKSIAVDMSTCYEYEIVLDQNDSLSSVPRDRNK